MYWNIDVTEEDEDEMIRKISEKIDEYDLDMAAIFAIEIIKPLNYVGVQLSRFFISPFFSAFGDNIGLNGEKFLSVFEKRDNVERLILAIEELKKQKEERKKAEKSKRQHEEKGWRRFLPF